MADRSEQLRARLIATFRVEARDHVRAIAADMEAIARAPDREAPEIHGRVESLFRNMHTLKGAARSVGLKQIESICQTCESMLRGVTQSKTAPSTAQLSALQTSAEDIARLLERDVMAPAAPAPSVVSQKPDVVARKPEALTPLLPSPRAEEPPGIPVGPSVASPQPAAGEQRILPMRTLTRVEADAVRPVSLDTIRVEVGRIDSLVTLAENLLTPKLSLGERVSDLKQLVQALNDLKRQVINVTAHRHSPGGQSNGPVFDDILREIEEARQQGATLLHGLDQDHAMIRDSVDGLFGELRSIRMMPAAIILEAFPLMVRDLARDLGKEVKWQALDTELVVDRKVLEFIKDPLIHLVRNAIDHGIEAPDVRERAGKPRRGRVRVTFSRPESGRIAIRVKDDGKGIDIQRIRQAAVRMRLVDDARAASLSDGEVSELVFRSGLSTSPVITTVSGHGLGLSVVRERVERLGGDIAVELVWGKGTTITFIVPESIATFRGLLAHAAGRSFLFPSDCVTRALSLTGADAEAAYRRRLLGWEDMTIPFAHLADVLGIPRMARSVPDDRVSCIVIDQGGQFAALAVDDIDGEREVLVKEFQWPIVRARHIAAVGLLGTGAQTLILRPTDLLRSIPHATTHGAGVAEVARRSLRRLRVLVVDDSITTRTMERHLFESSGFIVKVAADGLDAWNLLNSEEIDLVVSDIDMPRMDGFELTSRIRADPKLMRLPVILVTALESREDKEKGLRLGANAYVQKSTFDQSNLLDIVHRLI